MANKPNEANFFPDAPEFPIMGTFQPVYGKFDLTTYIQGASDYEIMAFLVGKYNACLEAYGTVTKLSTETVTACKQLQDWINNWFDNLDVQEELNKKIDSMVADGSFGTLLHQTFDTQINQQTTSAVTAWLVANVTPTGSAVVVDKSLSIEGAAADAKATGAVKKTADVNSEEIWTEFSSYTLEPGYASNNGIIIVDTQIGFHTSMIAVPPNTYAIKIITDSNSLRIPTINFYSYSNAENFVKSYTLRGTENIVKVSGTEYYITANCANKENIHIYYDTRNRFATTVDFRNFLPTRSIPSADVSQYMQTAINYCHDNNCALYIPSKNFNIAQQLTVYANTHIVGDGIYGETKQKEPDTYTIKYTGTGSMFNSTVPTPSLTIDGCIFVGKEKTNNCIFINGETSIVKNCTFYSFLHAIYLSNTKGAWTGEIKIHDNIFAIGYSGITTERIGSSTSDINDWEIYNNIFISNSISLECDFAVALKYYNNHDYSKRGIIVYNNSQHFEIFNNYFDNNNTSIRTPFSKQLNTISNNTFLLHIESDTAFNAITTSNNYTSNAFVQITNNLVSGSTDEYTNGAFISVANDFTNNNALTINMIANNFTSLAKGVDNQSANVTVTKKI